MNRTAIEWTHVFGEGSGYTWNPIVGCSNSCDYCYARRIATTRLAHLCEDCATFTPHIHRERLSQATPRQKPRGVFVGSLCDMWDSAVPQEWRDAVWEAMAQANQHVYFTLTKQPQNVRGGPARLWAGVTITQPADYWRSMQANFWPDFISFEPLLEFVCLEAMWGMPQWIIIGADSNANADREVPKREWVEHLVRDAQDADIPVFAKNNLARIMGAEWVAAHQQWPEELQKLREEART